MRLRDIEPCVSSMNVRWEHNRHSATRQAACFTLERKREQIQQVNSASKFVVARNRTMRIARLSSIAVAKPVGG
jgi:hypothetical protein